MSIVTDPFGLEDWSLYVPDYAQRPTARAQAIARLEAMEEQHAAFAYYDFMDTFFGDMKSTARRIWLWNEYSVYANMKGAAAEWWYWSNGLAFAGGMNEASDDTLLHELIHAYDDYHGYNIYGIRADLQERLAQVGSELATSYTLQFAGLEKLIADGRSCELITDHWNGIWRSLSNPQFQISLGNAADDQIWATKNDFRNAMDILGINFSCESMLPVYQQLIDSNECERECILRCP